MAGEQKSALEELALVLERLDIDYVVGGSIASGAWGEPRSTHDVDVLIRLDAERAAKLAAALKDRFYIDEDSVRAAMSMARAFNVIHKELFEKIDLFVAGSDALDTAQLERAVRRPLVVGSERTYPITSAEVVVVRKLNWYQRGNQVSDRQWRDVLAVLRVQGVRLNRRLMDELAASAGVEALLARACSEAWGSDPEPSSP